jgi:6,7-dimethyl-8-ribityllumazine synthase
MSTFVPARRRHDGARQHFAIVASQFNAEYVQGLVDHASEELRAISPGADIALHHVPGAFEIPVVVRELALQDKVDAIIAMGVIIRGKTAHAEHIGRAVSDALQRLAIAHGIPIIHAVLSVDDEEQARERCLGSRINRGTEAARTAVEIAGVMAELRR